MRNNLPIINHKICPNITRQILNYFITSQVRLISANIFLLLDCPRFFLKNIFLLVIDSFIKISQIHKPNVSYEFIMLEN